MFRGGIEILLFNLDNSYLNQILANHFQLKLE